MKKSWLLIAIVIIVLFFVLKDNFSINISSKSENTPVEQTSDLGTKENSEGPVSVTVTPTFNTNSWDFAVSLNTHSEELDMNLVEVSQLLDDQGKAYKAISWEGAPPGGHHREGILKFSPTPEGKNSFTSSKPKSIELRMKNIGGIERSFKWTF